MKRSPLFVLPLVVALVGCPPPPDGPVNPNPTSTHIGVPPPAAPQAGRPLLPPLYGVREAYPNKVKEIVAELARNLPQGQAALVANIPVTVDVDAKNPNEINAYAGCDDNGKAYMATTDAFHWVVDGMAQTRATDELYGTQTYEAYMNYATQKVVKEKANPGLPPGLIDQAKWEDPRRWSRAHEISEEIIAMVMAHELAHHYLGHTGCVGVFNPYVLLSRVGRKVLPALNQANEGMSDVSGVPNVLHTGKQRATAGKYRWTENGGVMIFDFFGRLQQAAGGGSGGFSLFSTHPNGFDRAKYVKATADNWRRQNPG